MATRVSFERAPEVTDMGGNIRSCAARGLELVERDCHKGERALICSTGPTITEKKVLSKVKRLAKAGWVVFGLKETIPFLKKHGVKVTYSVSMDPTGDRQAKRTPIDPGVIYCVASSCSPILFDHLIDGGCEVKVFHSACGHAENSYEPGIMIQLDDKNFSVVDGIFELETLDGKGFCPLVPMFRDEVTVYENEFKSNGKTAVMQGGFTVTNRALALAKFMGFEKITMAGTDFGWRKEGGSHYSELVAVETYDDKYMEDHGEVEGKPWYTKPDQLASAADVAKKIKAKEVTVLGDSLAVALSKRSDDFLENICRVEN